MITLLIVLGMVAYLIFWVGGGMLIVDEAMRHVSMLEASSENISRILSDVYVGTKNQAAEIEESLDRPERLMKLVERTITQNPRIRSCGISFIENYYPQKGRCFMPYAVRRDSSTIEVSDNAVDRQGYLEEDWFLQALKSEEGLWSEPFFEDNDTLHPLVAYLYPIRDKQGRTVAILGADLSLDWFQQKIDKRDWEIFANEWGGGHDKKEVQEMDERRQNRYLNRKPYSFLISGKGTFIVHPDRRRIIRDNYSSIANASSDTTAAVIGRKMMAGADCVEDDENIQECEDFDGCKCYVFYTPIKHTDWSMALVVPNQGIELIAYLVGGVLVFLIIVALVVVWIVSRITIRRAVNPLKQLASSADEVAKGNFDAALPTIKHNDEIRLLRNSFEDMQHSLTKYVNELQTTTASKAAMEKELKVAHDIQMSMLPKIFPPFPNRKDIDVSAILSPAKDVGGDLFDFYIRDEQLFFCIGDVSGKGVPASLVMAVTRSLFRNVSAHVAEPHLIVTALNEALAEGNEQCMFATLFVGVLDLATGRLRYCNAGHDAPLLIGDGVGTLPCDSNLPIGVMPDFEFSQQETDIFHQTTIFLYTDGLNEAEDIRQAQFGNKRVIEMAEKLLAEGNNQPETVIREMVEAVHSFVGKAEQSDDLTMLAIQYKSSQTDE